MDNRFNLTESEKNRIRGLHLTESKDKRITSVLHEQSISSPDGDDYEEVDTEVVVDIDEPQPTEPTPNDDQVDDDGKITDREYRRLEKSASRLLKTLKKNLTRTYKGKTINLYDSDLSVGGKEIQQREGELEFGKLKVRSIRYPYGDTRRHFVKYLRQFSPDEVESRLNRVFFVLSPANPGSPIWVNWLERVLTKDAEGYSKNLALTINCENERMWLRQEKPGADFSKDDSALRDTNVINTELMNDIKNSFCNSNEMGELKRIISKLSNSKFIPHADYAQVDDQDDFEEIV